MEIRGTVCLGDIRRCEKWEQLRKEGEMKGREKAGNQVGKTGQARWERA